MAKNRTKICIGCQHLFEARKDAKTCSARCRKRYQRARVLFHETQPVVWNISADKAEVNYGLGKPNLREARYGR